MTGARTDEVHKDDVLRDLRWVQKQIREGTSPWKLHSLIKDIGERCQGHPDAKVRELANKLAAVSVSPPR